MAATPVDAFVHDVAVPEHQMAEGVGEGEPLQDDRARRVRKHERRAVADRTAARRGVVAETRDDDLHVGGVFEERHEIGHRAAQVDAQFLTPEAGDAVAWSLARPDVARRRGRYGPGSGEIAQGGPGGDHILGQAGQPGAARVSPAPIPGKTGPERSGS